MELQLLVCPSHKITLILMQCWREFCVPLAEPFCKPDTPLEYYLSMYATTCRYACYLVLLKRKAGNEDRLEIPMFFG